MSIKIYQQVMFILSLSLTPWQHLGICHFRNKKEAGYMVHTDFWGKKSMTFQYYSRSKIIFSRTPFPCNWTQTDYCNTFPHERTSNNRKYTMPRTLKIIKHTFMITRKICILLCFQSFLLPKTFFFFNRGYFYTRSFQKYSRISVENSRTFQGYPTIFQFSRP